VKRSLDRLRAKVVERAQIVQVYALAYDSPDADVVAVNDFGGGMWYRQRGKEAAWVWRPNGYDGILFWTPSGFVEPWEPDFGPGGILSAEEHFAALIDNPHFASDVLTVKDQRLLLRALLASVDT
jgi:hypothetical protein